MRKNKCALEHTHLFYITGIFICQCKGRTGITFVFKLIFVILIKNFVSLEKIHFFFKFSSSCLYYYRSSG